jgi:hypothetical protein
MLLGVRNEVVKHVLLAFRPRFTPGGRVLWVSEGSVPTFASNGGLRDLGVGQRQLRELPNVVIHSPQKSRLALIDIAILRGPMTQERRSALADAFRGCRNAGLVFVSAFANRNAMRSFVSQISWETEVWVASDPDHMIHFNGERFLGPYPDVVSES